MMKTEGPSAFFAGAIPRCVQVRLLANVASDRLTDGPLTMPVRMMFGMWFILCGCPKLGTPKSTMLLCWFMKNILSQFLYDNLWVLSIFWTAPRKTANMGGIFRKPWRITSSVSFLRRSPLRGGYDQRYQLRPLPGDQCLGKRSMARRSWGINPMARVMGKTRPV